MTQAIQTFHVEKPFHKQHGKMLNAFHQRFANPLVATSERFIWDVWSVPGQYNHLRTPFLEMFEPGIQDSFLQTLGDFGRKHLGCQHISEPWLSVYMDGHQQQMHTDPTHGPWAFVYVLQAPNGTGGETMVARDDLTSFWENAGGPKEMKDFFQKIPARTNQLTVFDPRLPHFVPVVQGPRDFKDARIVIHGWFTDPRASVDGPLANSKQTVALLNDFVDDFGEGLDVTGFVTAKIFVAPSGKVQKAEIPCSSLRQDGILIKPAAILNRLNPARLTFPKAAKGSLITLPILMD